MFGGAYISWFEPLTELWLFILAANMVLGLAAVAARPFKPPLLALAPAVSVLALTGFGLTLPHPPAVVSADADIKVLSVNVSHRNSDIAPLSELIRDFDPDIVVVIEASEDTLLALSSALPDYPGQFSCEEIPYCGAAIFSKFEGRRIRGGFRLSYGLQRPPPLDPSSIPIVAVEFEHPRTAGERFVVAGVHAQRNGGVVARPSGVGWMLDFLHEIRRADHVLVAGDLNASDRTWTMRRIDREAGLTRVTHDVPTWPVPHALARKAGADAVLGIDHVLAGSSLLPVYVRRGPDIGSDHYPLLSAFSFAH